MLVHWLVSSDKVTNIGSSKAQRLTTDKLLCHQYQNLISEKPDGANIIKTYALSF